ncbi:MAG TPA: exodeoxyribonuclease VII large subunit [Longimicrobiales bacterium]
MRRDPFFAEARAPVVPVAGDPGGRGGVASHAATGQVYTVSAVNALVRDFLEGAFPPLWVAGEVSGWKRHTSGHCYFGLRDATAQLRCVMFRSDAQRLPTDPDEGMEVRALGTLTLYERRGDYQLVVRELEAEGAGGLWRLAFERLRARLEAEGLLAPERKRSLPRCPAKVAVVTSPMGAALHDILHVIERRAPWTRIIIAPAKVQGDGAAEDVARAIERVGWAGVADVVIVARGGGSVEDLWAFNEEVVARAIAACPIPVISGVGHEVDVTIADLVADARAPTPSAAAEMAVPDGQALARHLEDLGGRLPGGLRQLLAEWRGELMLLRAGLGRAAREAVRRRRERLLQAAAKLDALSPLAALRRGYAVPLGDDGRVLRRAGEFVRGGRFRLRVVDGNVRCRVDDVGEVPDAEGSDG